MKSFLLLSFTFFFATSYSQDTIVYRKHVDSILLSRAKIRTKKIKVQFDTLRIRYLFNKNTKTLEVIEVTQPNKNDWTWIYGYHFIDGRLVMISKYNNHPLGDNKREIALYYFKNNEVIFRDENRTQIEDVSAQIKRAEQLKFDAPKY